MSQQAAEGQETLQRAGEDVQKVSIHSYFAQSGSEGSAAEQY